MVGIKIDKDGTVTGLIADNLSVPALSPIGDIKCDVLMVNGVQVAPPPDGFIRSANPDTGKPERMAVWLPPGETAESLGLETFIPAHAELDGWMTPPSTKWENLA